ncbi:MAG: hypothetical protein P8Q39_05395, partial [Candidatus Thalassarchaeaceae archaeon]|nr:hypothetical protein [Candidatus Thalassarchaeaceae archaeon]
DGDGWSDAADYYPKDAERHVKSKLPMIILISILIAGLIGVSTLMIMRRKSDDSSQALGQLMTAPPPPMGAFEAPPPPMLATPPPPMATAPPPVVEAPPAPVPEPVQQGPPPIPAEGLPAGWTQEQWNYYGQEWLDNNS